MSYWIGIGLMGFYSLVVVLAALEATTHPPGSIERTDLFKLSDVCFYGLAIIGVIWVLRS